jgi:predicted PolB exonuclease-like 3'-5' exonuclease
MNEKSFTAQLNKESKARKEMIDDALEAMNNYSEEIIKKDKNLEQYKIEEIKYKTTIKELNDYIEIYKNKISSYEEENKELEKEVMSLRKKNLKDSTNLSSLQSILENFIHEYGIETVSTVTKLTSEQLEKLKEK